jgi:hypothetical protein
MTGPYDSENLSISCRLVLRLHKVVLKYLKQVSSSIFSLPFVQEKLISESSFQVNRPYAASKSIGTSARFIPKIAELINLSQPISRPT